MKGPPLPAPEHRTVNDALTAAARTRSGITFVDLHERETFLSFSEIHARARRIAAALRRLGVSAGDRVALVFPTSPAFMDAFFGALLAGAVPVPLYPPFRLGRLPEYHAATARMIDAVGARLVLADARTRRLLGQAIELSRPRLGCRTLDDLGPESAGEVQVAVDPDDLGAHPVLVGLDERSEARRPLAQQPDGSAGRSQGAVAARTTACRSAACRGCRSTTTWASSAACSSRCTTRVRWSSSRPSTSWPGRRSGCGRSPATAPPSRWRRRSPTRICAKRVRDEELEGMDLSSWRLAVCGAEPVSAGALDRFAQRFARFGFDASALRPVYGLAEASLAVTFAPPARPPKAIARGPGPPRGDRGGRRGGAENRLGRDTGARQRDRGARRAR